MPQMTPAAARVIDPILTTVARGYRSNKAPVADLLFPIVPVTAMGGRIISFGPDDFKLYSTKYAPGSNTKRVQFGYASTPYALLDYRLEGSVPVRLLREGQAVPGIDQASIAIARVRNVQALEREKEAADLALNAASYGAGNKLTLAPGDRWDEAAGDPFADIAAAKEAIRQQTGERPNVLTLGPKVMTGLRNSTKVLDRISTSKDRNPATLAQLQDLFEIERVVEAGAIYHNGTAFVDVWGTFAHLAYTTPASAAEMGSPSFGYTYQLEGEPNVEEGYLDRNTNTWYYPVSDARQPVLTGAAAGFLFTTAVTP